MDDATLERFWARIKIDENGCWIWQGARGAGGYGQMSVNGRRVLTHRLAFEHYKRPFAEGEQADHLCRVRPCANPEHMEGVSSRTNTQRGMAPMMVLHRNRICKNGHPMVGDNIAKGPHGSKLCRLCRNARAQAKRKARYHSDPAFRERINQQSERTRQKRKSSKGATS